MNAIIYLLVFLPVYLYYAMMVFGPILVLFVLIEPIAPILLLMLDDIMGIVGIPLLVLLIWFSHQTTKRIAYHRLSFAKSVKGTLETAASYFRNPARPS